MADGSKVGAGPSSEVLLNSNISDNLCGVCKSNTAIKRVQCFNCKVFYHNSCFPKLKNTVTVIDANTIKCCETSTHDVSDILDESSMEDEESLKLENKYLKALIRAKNEVIATLKEKNLLLEKFSHGSLHDNQVAPTPAPSTAENEKLTWPLEKVSALTSVSPAHAPTSQQQQPQTRPSDKRNVGKQKRRPTSQKHKNDQSAGDGASRADSVGDAEPVISSKTNSWTKVVKKRKSVSEVPNMPVKIKASDHHIIGNNANSNSIKVVPRKAFIYVSRLCPKTEPDQVRELLVEKFPETQCEKLDTKQPSYYSAFKVTVDLHHFKDALDPTNWPYGCFVTRYFRRNRPKQDTK